MVARTKLKSMTSDELIVLRSQIDEALVRQISKERDELDRKLEQVGKSARPGVTRGAARNGRRGRRKLKGRKLAAKYRNPANRSETWAGRGLKPRWLTAALRKGKKLEDFLIK